MPRGEDRRPTAAGNGAKDAGGGSKGDPIRRDPLRHGSGGVGGGGEGAWHRREVVVRQRVGTHLRVVKRIFERAQKFDAEMFLSSAQHRANARSMLDLMQLAARAGDRVWIESRGRDAERAATFAAAVLQASDWDVEIPDA